ncbi:unnamed protein product [Spirodela intermedia]|uniref:Uncharacterized protein n=2 Tax=Spirodela intermedia TaxID=51605 RepID=A0A7I8K2C8_SPIIN|nr:unnamed protein product [Spirodela intermedia]CAA6655304.1 unnamed protein product [Spirodela intermedia]CAA7390534.1 unnamed protein product [Spirodela intermedia]
MGAARTQAPSGTNYDVHSPTWGDGRRALWAVLITHEPRPGKYDLIDGGYS